MTVDDSADLEEGPSGRVTCGSGAGSVDLDEICQVERFDVGNTGKDDEELEEDASA